MMVTRSMNALGLKPTAVALALAAFSLGASALPNFTFDPAAVGLGGTTSAPFSADNLLVFNYSTVTSSGPTFSETGYLSVSAAQLGSQLASTPGLNSSYGLYIQFTGSGSTIFGTNPLTGPTLGTITSLSYTIYGYNGTATFGFDGSNMPTTTATGAIALASGSLIGTGSVTTSVSAPSFAPTANATLTMAVNPANAAFFAAPTPFLNSVLTAFSNTSSQVSLFNGGFMIQQGGGSVNFATAVPEPESYAMLATGLVAVAFLARRRKARQES